MSTPLPVFLGKVERLELLFDRPDVVSGYLRGLDGQDVEVVIRKLRSQRSLAQNSYWHGVAVKLIADYTGDDHMAVHYALLGECFGYHFNPKIKRELPNKGSSRALTVEEFTHLIEWCPPWAQHELGVEIPLPNEVEA